MNNDYDLEWDHEYRLGDAVKIHHGYAFKGKNMTTENINNLPIVVNIVNFNYTGGFRFNSTKVQYLLTEYKDKFRLKPNDILVIMTCQTEKGEILGVPGLISNDDKIYLHNQRMGKVAITNPSKINDKFLYYLFLYPEFNYYLYNTSSGIKILHTAPSRIENYHFSRPPMYIQEKIGSFLSDFDRLYEINLKRIKLLEDMAQIIYFEWFVNFKFPEYEKTEIIETEHGLTPKGWKWQKIGDILKLVYGKGLRKHDRIQGEYPVYGSSGIIDYHNDYLVKGPAIIVGRKGNVGSIYWSQKNCNPIDTVYYVESNVSLHYLYYNLQNQNFINAHAAVPGLNRNQAYSLPILIPNNKILKKFTNMTKPIFNLIDNVKKKNEVLIKNRKILLPKLISGEIDVSDSDINIGG